MNKEKTAIEKVANMNLEGLLLPESAPVSYWWIWMIVGLLILIISIVWIRKYHSPKATALRQLKQLRKELSIDEHDYQKIKKQVARSLCHGFGATRLDNVMPNNMKWREYLRTLETTLYSNKPTEPQALSSLIKTAQNWLRVNS